MPKTLPFAVLLALAPAMVGPAAAQVDMSAAQAACQGDVLRLCPETVLFGRSAIIACMHQHRPSLSPQCGAIFDRGTRAMARHPSGSLR